MDIQWSLTLKRTKQLNIVYASYQLQTDTNFIDLFQRQRGLACSYKLSFTWPTTKKQKNSQNIGLSHIPKIYDFLDIFILKFFRPPPHPHMAEMLPPLLDAATS